MTVIGEVFGNWAALSYLSPAAVTPLGAVSVIVNAILARRWLSETITDEFNDLNAQQKRDLEHLIDATLDKISEEQRGEYSKLCKGVVSVRHAPNEKALSVIKGNLKAEMKIACTNIAIGVMAVQDHYIFPEDLKLNP